MMCLNVTILQKLLLAYFIMIIFEQSLHQKSDFWIITYKYFQKLLEVLLQNFKLQSLKFLVNYTILNNQSLPINELDRLTSPATCKTKLERENILGMQKLDIHNYWKFTVIEKDWLFLRIS